MANDNPGPDIPSEGHDPQVTRSAGRPPQDDGEPPDRHEPGAAAEPPAAVGGTAEPDTAGSDTVGPGTVGSGAMGESATEVTAGQHDAGQHDAGQDDAGQHDAEQGDAGQDDAATPKHGIRPVPVPQQSGGAGQYGPGPTSYGPTSYGPTSYGYAAAYGYAPSPYGQYPLTAAYGSPYGPAHEARPAPRVTRGVLIAFALVTALLGGLIGGAVGASLTDRGGSIGVLGSPLPEVEESSLPVGPVEVVAERVLPSVVRLLVEGTGVSGEGSGMVLSPDGLMLTNNHVVAPAADGGSIVAVFQDGSSAPADIVGLDPSSDLAVIRAQGVAGLSPIEFGNSDAVRVGQQVVAVGSPLGLGGTVTAGIISAVDRTVSVDADSGASEATVLSALQTDAAINPGNSGGPLTDMAGRVVGINSVIATTGAEGGSIGVGFAIPINQASRTAEELETTGVATRAVLGANVTANPAERNGAVLGPLVPGGPADRAGLREGQTVTRVDDRIVTNGSDLVAAIRDNAPEDRVTLVVDGQPVDVVLGGESG